LAILLAAAAAVLVAGCSSGGENALSADTAVQTNIVTMPRSYKFEPAVISIKRGTTVTWKNKDNFTHDVTIEVDGEKAEHTAPQGEDVKITFDTKGTFDYVCRFHSKDMRGKVIVT
ncbi:MAG: Blue (Type 1) copper protein, partial [Thermoleophilia bacterium]|nr:Blue (Type 1) copper protein [Thermoleophilia bacterium]